MGRKIRNALLGNLWLKLLSLLIAIFIWIMREAFSPFKGMESQFHGFIYRTERNRLKLTR